MSPSVRAAEQGSYRAVLAMVLTLLILGITEPASYVYRHTLSGHLAYLLRVLPRSEMVWAGLLLFAYRRELSWRELFLKNAVRGVAAGVVLAPVVFWVMTRFLVRLDPEAAWPALGRGGLSLDDLRSAFSFPINALPLRPLSETWLGRALGYSCEEICVRGVFLTLMVKRGVAPAKALGWSGLLFGVLHGQWLAVPTFVAWSVLVGGAYLWTGSLWTPIMIHVFQNEAPRWSVFLRP